MKRIKRRAGSALLLALLLLAGTGTLIVRLLRYGDSWATYNANTSVYSENGVLSRGTLTDRNGVLLAAARDGSYRYADDTVLRRASLHAVGDYRGRIASAALSTFARRLTGYSPATGTTAGEGETVALALDAELQKTAWTALLGRAGAVLVMNYETGEVLCLVSSPNYDPYTEPDETVEGIYLNRAFNATYTPGSVFKLVTLAAAVENIDNLYGRTFYCSGEKSVPGGRVTCMSAHGTQTIEQALANSCNCAFAQLSLELGGETLKRYADKFGFTDNLYMDDALSAAGHFDACREKDSYLAWSGVGQYTDMICPYAMLRYCAAIANGGTVKEPTLLLGGSNGSTRLLKKETAQALGEMMSYTFITHYRDSFPGLDLCAKTGTAEVGDGTNNAWMTGYVRKGSAPLAFVVVLEKGGMGITGAGSVAAAVMEKAEELYRE